MPSPVQSNVMLTTPLQTGSTVLSGQWDTHNRSACNRSTCSLNQWVRSLVGLFTSAGTGEYFPPLQFTCRNCGGGDRGRVAIYRPFGEVSLSLNRTVTCMVLKANDRRTSCPCHDEFRGHRSDYVRQVALATTTTTLC
ncbi:uncharacterized protein TNCV_2318721 [Trichonephila clavipes]|nr:uncharacterized protein TNCV_2318721 [Trichonephila clavipes]